MKNSQTSAFRAVVWKEIRETWLMTLGFALFVGCVIARNYYAAVSGDPGDAVTLIWSENWIVLLFAIPVFGLVLGLRQVLPEQTGDRAAFLLHRPVSPSVIFLGKVTAAVVLFSLSVLVPLVSAGIVFSKADFVPAIWDWHILNAYFIPYLAGLTFYFSSMISANINARWFGSKPLPIIAAVVCAMTAVADQEFRFALAITAVAGVLFASAAQGRFGVKRSQGRQSKLSLIPFGIILLVGVAGVWATGYQLLYSALPRRAIFIQQGIRPEVVVLEDGQLAVGRQGKSGAPFYTDFSGKRINIKSKLESNYLGQEGPMNSYTTLPFWDPERQVVLIQTYFENDAHFEADAPDNIYVYYRTSDHTIRTFTHNIRVFRDAWLFHGTVDYDGIAPGIVSLRPAPRQIFMDNSATLTPSGSAGNLPALADPKIILLSASELVSINLRTGLPAVLYRSQPGESLLCASRVADGTASITWAIAGTHGLIVKVPGRPALHLPVMLTTDQLQTLSGYRNSRGELFMRYWTGEELGGMIVLQRFAPSGQLMSTVEVPNLTVNSVYVSPSVAKTVITASKPLLLAIATELFQRKIERQVELQGVRPEYEHMRVKFNREIIKWSVAVGLMCAIVSWLYGGRAGLRMVSRIIWSIAVFPLGLIGLLTQIAFFGFPSTTECPTCKKRRLVGQDLCRFCKAPWPPQEPNRTEIRDAEPAANATTVSI